MELRRNQAMTRARLAAVIGTSLAVYSATYVLAKTDYPDWMWLLVIAGLVLPWVALLGAIGVVVRDHLDRD